MGRGRGQKRSARLVLDGGSPTLFPSTSTWVAHSRHNARETSCKAAFPVRYPRGMSFSCRAPWFDSPRSYQYQDTAHRASSGIDSSRHFPAASRRSGVGSRFRLGGSRTHARSRAKIKATSWNGSRLDVAGYGPRRIGVSLGQLSRIRQHLVISVSVYLPERGGYPVRIGEHGSAPPVEFRRSGYGIQNHGITSYASQRLSLGE